MALMSRIRNKISSDKAAVGTTETIVLIALAIFGTIIIVKYIMVPLQSSSEGIGQTIEEMNPKE